MRTPATIIGAMLTIALATGVMLAAGPQQQQNRKRDGSCVDNAPTTQPSQQRIRQRDRVRDGSCGEPVQQRQRRRDGSCRNATMSAVDAALFQTCAEICDRFRDAACYE